MTRHGLADARGRILPLALFLGTFAWSLVYVSLPFYIQRISTADPATTLRWTGWILGISSLVTVVTTPMWGKLAERRNPKAFYVATVSFQGFGFVGMAMAHTLLQLFFARLVLGIMGAASTFAFIMAARSRDTDVRREVSAIQSAMILGQLFGPLAGAIAAARIGFVQSFLVGAALLWLCGGLVQWRLPRPELLPTTGIESRTTSWREVLAMCLLVLGGSVQVFFLSAVLPQILPALGVAPRETLEVAGLIIFASGAAAALGSLAAPRLAEFTGERRVVVGVLALSSVLLALLGLAGDVWSFGVLRSLQVFCVAPVFPLVVAAMVQRTGGGAIGFINSSRIGAAFVGPVVSTMLLVSTTPAVVYTLLAVSGLACVPLAWSRWAFRARGAGGRS